MASGPQPGLFDASGLASRMRASPLLAIGPSEPGPALRRGALLAVPVACALLLELGLGAPTQGAIAVGASICGFAAMDAPARTRVAWQLPTAIAIGLTAALGVLSSQVAVLAVLAMGLVGLAAGYCFAVSLRLAICGLSVVLGLLISQGLGLPASDVGRALLYGTAGALTQPLWSLLVWLAHDRGSEPPEDRWSAAATAAALRANLSLDSHAARHAIRFGAALAAGVAFYRLAGLEDHGYWVPLTILFVMRPERVESYRRIVLRGVGTAVGLVLATALAEAIGSELAIGAILALAAALAYGTITVQYAVYTAAITIYVVLLTATVDEPAFDAVGQRALGTAVGLAIVFVSFLVWGNRDEPLARRRPMP